MVKIILVITLFFHLLFLNLSPSGITNDELHFVLNAKSVFLNFSNLANNWNPLSFTTIPQETSSELTFLIFAPIIGPLPLNLFTARLPLALLSIGSVYLLYLISQKIFSKKIAIIVAFIASLNPWFFYVYRTAFDAPVAIFFLLLSFYCLIKLNHWILLTLIPITFAFYTYIGTKVVVFPYVLIISIYLYTHLSPHKNLQKIILLNLYTLFISLIFILNLSHSSIGQRTGELVTPWSSQIIQQVEQKRSESFNTRFAPLFINKFSTYIQFTATKWFNSFSPNLLFLIGDETFTGSLWRQGYFYLIDAFFILFGFIYIFKKFPANFYLLLSLLIISPVPEIIRKDQIPAYVFHASLQYPILVILSGAGMYYLLKLLKNSNYKIGLFFIYSLFFVNYLYIYLFQYPIYASESFNFSNRVLSNYLINSSQLPNTKVYIFCREPDALFKSYLFYANLLNSRTFERISNLYVQGFSKSFIIDNLTFLHQDDVVKIQKSDIVIVENGVNAPNPINQDQRTIIYRLDNHQPAFNIYGHNICHNSLPTNHNLVELNIDSTSSTLCKFIAPNEN